MNIHIYIYIYIHICIHVYICILIHIYIHLSQERGGGRSEWGAREGARGRGVVVGQPLQEGEVRARQREEMHRDPFDLI